jgi:hypothetical protein
MTAARLALILRYVEAGRPVAVPVTRVAQLPAPGLAARLAVAA